MKQRDKWLSLLLALVLCVSVLPLSALAVEDVTAADSAASAEPVAAILDVAAEDPAVITDAAESDAGTIADTAGEPAADGAAVPALDAAVTAKNILALLDAYDPDDAYILRWQQQEGDDVTVWWGPGDRILDELDTAVHEECHGYTHIGYRQNRYYIGGGGSIAVTLTDFFYTVEMAPSIPEAYRTFRYDTYIGSPTPYLSSNEQGIYGLLDEFTAYGRGMTVSASMYDYLVSAGAADDDWFTWVNDCENDYLAFAEFQYYILFYMDYARSHYPNVYNAVLANTDFLTAFQKIHANYTAQINRYLECLDKLEALLTSRGRRVRLDDDAFMIGYTGIRGDVHMLLDAAGKYGDILAAMGVNGGGQSGEFTDPFTDVDASASYYKAVMWAYTNGIVKGTSATTFSPNADCTRGQFALMLYRLAGKPDVTGLSNPFTDVKKSDAYYKAVLWAYSEGVIKGTSATKFSPGSPITRGQIVTMLYRMAGRPSVAGTANPFADVAAGDSYYKPVLWAVGQGITKGTSATTFSPNRNCTRYQLVTFLYRFNNLMGYI